MAVETKSAIPSFEAVTMPFTVAELAEDVRETNRRLTDAIEGLRAEFSGLREDFSDLRKEVAVTNNSLGWVIKIGTSIGTSLVACMLGILTFAYRVDQNATRIEVTVVALKTDFADFKARATRTEEAVVALKTDFADLKAQGTRTEEAVVALRADFVEFKTESKARDKQISDSFDRIEKMLARQANK
jgi:predicted  nucleic acid-binding Zn-ribbon protein